MDNIIFHVNEEEGVVVATMPRFIEDFRKEIAHFSWKNPFLNYYFIDRFCKNKLFPKYINNIKNLKGVSKCRKEDTFSIEKDKKIAEAKLLCKTNELKKKFYFEIYWYYFESMRSLIKRRFSKLSKNVKRYSQVLKELKDE